MTACGLSRLTCTDFATAYHWPRMPVVRRSSTWSLSTLLMCILLWRHALGVLPSPLWGGVGGGGRAIDHKWGPLLSYCTTPLPSPPPQGGREHSEFAVRIDSTSPTSLPRAAALRALDLGDRMIRRVGGRHRLAVADDHAHQRLLDALVDEPAIHAGRHREQVALLEHGLEALALMLDDEAKLVAPEHEEHFLGIGMEMERAFAARRQDHGREGEVLGRHRVVVAVDAGAAGPDIAHLGAAIFRIVVGLKLERVPIERARLMAGDARVEPRFQRRSLGIDDVFRPDLGINGLVFHGFPPCDPFTAWRAECSATRAPRSPRPRRKERCRRASAARWR